LSLPDDFTGIVTKRDVTGPKAARLSTIWINASGHEIDQGIDRPDFVLRDLQYLLER
jgi:hypothetical protein